MAIVEKSAGNLKKCLCPNCPTYNECARDERELLFCAKDMKRGICKFEMKGCICPVCPVYKEKKLNASSYCIYGAAENVEF